MKGAMISPLRMADLNLKIVSDVSSNHLLVPSHADPRHVRNMQLAIPNLIGSLQHRI
jgi:hypothetical protein